MGLTEEQFWSLTPHDYNLRVRGLNKHRKWERERDRVQSWYIGYLGRVKRFPSLKRFMMDFKAKKLKGKALDKRKKEFDELTVTMKAKGK